MYWVGTVLRYAWPVHQPTKGGRKERKGSSSYLHGRPRYWMKVRNMCYSSACRTGTHLTNLHAQAGSTEQSLARQLWGRWRGLLHTESANTGPTNGYVRISTVIRRLIQDGLVRQFPATSGVVRSSTGAQSSAGYRPCTEQ